MPCPAVNGEEHMTVSQCKAHAALTHHDYKEVMHELKKASGADISVATMKSAFRMLQKSIFSSRIGSGDKIGNCRAVCDVNRALVTAEDAVHARKIVDALADMDTKVRRRCFARLHTGCSSVQCA